MPTLKRSATLFIGDGFAISLPMAPPIVVHGKGVEGKVVCQLHISASGFVVTGPKGKTVREFNWDQVVDFMQDD